jgi:hypothetical protein
MARTRTACTDCSIPFYSDENETYPYCAAADRGVVVSPEPTEAAEPEEPTEPARERVVCDTCGLTHYADAEECQYCVSAAANAAAGSESEAEAGAKPGPELEADPDPEAESDTEPASEPEAPPPVQRREERANGGNTTPVGRVLGAVRSLFGR